MKIIRIFTLLCAFAAVAPVCAKQQLYSDDPHATLQLYIERKKQEHERACAYLALQQGADGIVRQGAQASGQSVCPIVAQNKAQGSNVQAPAVASSSSSASVHAPQSQPHGVAQPQQVPVTPQQSVQPQQINGVQQQVYPNAVVRGAHNSEVDVQEAQGDGTRWIGENSYWAQNVSAPINENALPVGLGLWAGSWAVWLSSLGFKLSSSSFYALHKLMGYCSQSLADGAVGSGVAKMGSGLDAVGNGVKTAANTVTCDRLSKAYLAWQIVDHRLSGRPLSDTFKLWPAILPIALGLAVNYTFAVDSPVHTAYTYCQYAKNAYDAYCFVNNMPQMQKDFERMLAEYNAQRAQTAAGQPDVDEVTEVVGA
jgi:hypothetical protein